MLNIIVTLVAICFCSTLFAFELENRELTVKVDPTNLKIDVGIKKTNYSVSSGAESRSVSDLKTTESSAKWAWPEKNLKFSTEIKGRDLLVTAKATAKTEIVFPIQVPAAAQEAWLLPMSEGYYVPMRDKVWESYLLQYFSDFDTTQGLSLPLLTARYPNRHVDTLFLTPWNNKVRLSKSTNGISIKTTHEFTKMDYKTPYSVLFSFSDADLLSAPKRYRRHLVETKQFVPLRSKLKKKQLNQLAGAAHVYFWGDSILDPANVRNWRMFASDLKSSRASHLVERFSKEGKKIVTSLKGRAPYQYERYVLLQELTNSLFPERKYDWPKTKEAKSQIESIFGKNLVAKPKWVGGLSAASVKAIKKAGIERVWIGLPKWQTAYFAPNAIELAKKYNYLVAPYDSYNTVLKPGNEPDWISAHFDEKAYKTCGIVKKNGKRKSGFKGSGVYANPTCIRPYFEERINQLHKDLKFNSWFLDADATGMAFDDYNPKFFQSQREGLEKRISRAQHTSGLGVVVGSEYGHATSNTSIAFAHGMHLGVLAWGDKEMYKKRNSKFFLGPWFPSHEPHFMFKEVPLKENYRKVFTDPKYRLPMFQAVFHDSVVTTAHWHHDLLKFNNARGDVELSQLLYNVPPIVHLSRSSLKKRLPILSKNLEFFAPTHKRLFDQAIVDFSWIGGNRNFQRVVFSDGSQLVANFSTKQMKDGNISVAKRSVVLLEGGKIARKWQTKL